jgi:hypothetical protein
VIPPDQRAGLKRLAGLDDAQLAQLEEKLRSTPVRIDRDEFVKGIGQVEGVPEPHLHQVLDALMYLSVFLATPPPDMMLGSIVSDIVDSLRQSGFDDSTELERLRIALSRLLALDAIISRAKALDLQVDQARAFQTARILTDVRPVFSSGESMRIVGLLVVHTLKLEYFEESESKEFFLALDEYDLGTLKKALLRAELKGEAIKSQLVDALGVTDFGTVGGRKDEG